MPPTTTTILSPERSQTLAPKERFQAWEAKLQARAAELGPDLAIEDARLLSAATVFGAGMVDRLHVTKANVTYEITPDLKNPEIRTEGKQSGSEALRAQMQQLQLATEFTRTIDVTDPALNSSQETAYVNMTFVREQKGLSREYYGNSYAVAVIGGGASDLVTMRVEFLGAFKTPRYLTLQGTPDLINPKALKWQAFYDEKTIDASAPAKHIPLGVVEDPTLLARQMQTAYVDNNLPKLTSDLLAQSSAQETANKILSSN